jgi:hypothetical protein
MNHTKIRPVLVTGAPRSGTTWIGSVLSESNQLYYFHEPFNCYFVDIPLRGKNLPFNFMYINGKNEKKYRAKFRRIMQLRPHWYDGLTTARNKKDIDKLLSTRTLLSGVRKERKAPLIKDPLAVFSSDWLSNKFDMNVVITIRHPAAFVYSFTKLGWNSNLLLLLSQDHLMRDHLSQYLEEIKKIGDKGSSIEKASLLWKLIHHTLITYKKKNTNWIYIRHEDISLKPYQGFKYLYGKLGLEFTEKDAAIIEDYCGNENPVEQQHYWQVKRNSKAIIGKWREGLSGNEVKTIQKIVGDVGVHFYNANEW